MHYKSETAGMAGQRSQLYGLLARVYSCEPDAALIGTLKTALFKEAFTEMGAEFEPGLFDQSEDVLMEELAVEFSRLFLGPGPHLSPHESLHHELPAGKWGQLWGDSTVEVKNFIEATGLTIESELNLIPDHISVELEFMQLLTGREAKMREKGDDENAEICLDLERDFFQRHPGSWVPAFCDKVIATTQSSFYREMASLTKKFLEFEKENLQKSLAGG